MAVVEDQRTISDMVQVGMYNIGIAEQKSQFYSGRVPDDVSDESDWWRQTQINAKTHFWTLETPPLGRRSAYEYPLHYVNRIPFRRGAPLSSFPVLTVVIVPILGAAVQCSCPFRVDPLSTDLSTSHLHDTLP